MQTVMKHYPKGTIGAIEGYRKVYWSNGKERTAGLIFRTEKLRQIGIEELSRHWPMSEASKMSRLILHPTRETFEEAFAD